MAFPERPRRPAPLLPVPQTLVQGSVLEPVIVPQVDSELLKDDDLFVPGDLGTERRERAISPARLLGGAAAHGNAPRVPAKPQVLPGGRSLRPSWEIAWLEAQEKYKFPFLTALPPPSAEC